MAGAEELIARSGGRTLEGPADGPNGRRLMLATLSLVGDPAQVGVVTAVGLLAFTGATIVTGLRVAASLLGAGLLALLLLALGRRRSSRRRHAA